MEKNIKKKDCVALLVNAAIFDFQTIGVDYSFSVRNRHRHNRILPKY